MVVDLGEELGERAAAGHAVPHPGAHVGGGEADREHAVREGDEQDPPEGAPEVVGQGEGRQLGAGGDLGDIGNAEASDQPVEDEDEEHPDQDDREDHRQGNVAPGIGRFLGQRRGALPAGQCLDVEDDGQGKARRADDVARVEGNEGEAAGARAQDAGETQGEDDEHLDAAGDQHELGRELDAAMLHEGNERGPDDDGCRPEPGHVDVPVGLELTREDEAEEAVDRAAAERRIEDVHPGGQEAGPGMDGPAQVRVVAAGRGQVLGELDQGVAKHQHDQEAHEVRQRRRDARVPDHHRGVEEGGDRGGDVGDALHRGPEEPDGVLLQVALHPVGAYVTPGSRGRSARHCLRSFTNHAVLRSPVARGREAGATAGPPGVWQWRSCRGNLRTGREAGAGSSLRTPAAPQPGTTGVSLCPAESDCEAIAFGPLRPPSSLAIPGPDGLVRRPFPSASEHPRFSFQNTERNDFTSPVKARGPLNSPCGRGERTGLATVADRFAGRFAGRS